MACLAIRELSLRTLASTFCLLAVIEPFGARADTEQPRVSLGPWAGDLDIGPGMNAVGKHLRGSQFVGQDFRGAVFDGCDLYGVRFWQCNLQDASFRDAYLTGAIFDDCSVSGADFTDAVINGIVLPDPQYDLQLTQDQFTSTASYKTKKLSKCLVYGYERHAHAVRRYDFRGADLSHAIFIGGDLTQSDFADANIANSEFRTCTISFDQLASTQNFKGSRGDTIGFEHVPAPLRFTLRGLWGIVFSGTRIQGRADFSGLNLTGVQLSISFSSADFTGAVISRCVLGSAITQDHLRSTASYQEGDLSGVWFGGMDLSGCDLSRQNLTGCQFTGCNLTDCVLNDAVISDVNFAVRSSRPNVGLTAQQIKSTWNYRQGRMEGVVLPEELSEALKQEER